MDKKGDFEYWEDGNMHFQGDNEFSYEGEGWAVINKGDVQYQWDEGDKELDFSEDGTLTFELYNTTLTYDYDFDGTYSFIEKMLGGKSQQEEETFVKDLLKWIDDNYSITQDEESGEWGVEGDWDFKTGGWYYDEGSQFWYYYDDYTESWYYYDDWSGEWYTYNEDSGTFSWDGEYEPGQYYFDWDSGDMYYYDPETEIWYEGQFAYAETYYDPYTGHYYQF